MLVAEIAESAEEAPARHETGSFLTQKREGSLLHRVKSLLPRRPVTGCERLWDPASQEYKESFSDMVDVIKRAALERQGQDSSDPALGEDFLASWPLDLSNCRTSLHAVEIIEIILGAPANKRPGPDGIAAEFFKRFAKRLAPIFQEA